VTGSSLPSTEPVVSWTDIVVTLAKHVRILAVVTLGLAVTTTIVLLLLPNHYTATITLVPEVKPAVLPGQLSNLAALAGVSIGGASASQSPQFYAAVLTSKPIQYAVLKRRYPTAGLGGSWQDQDSATLIEILAPPGRTADEQLWNAAMLLARRTDISTDQRTSIIRIAITLPTPVLSAAVANAFGEELNRFNREVRQSQARGRRIFAEDRVKEVSAELVNAEVAIRDFFASNREYQNSPRLVFEYNRLQRSLTVQQELYLDLRRQLDAARLAEVDDLPVITIVETAIPPQRKSGPRRSLWLVTVVVLSTGAFAAVLVIRDHHEKVLPGAVAALRAGGAQ